MTELVRSELIHCRPEPWADRARVYIPDMDAIVDGLTERAARVIAAHAAADALGLDVDQVAYTIGLPDPDSSGSILTDGWMCRIATGGWDLFDPLERHAFNLRELFAERLAVDPDPGCLLAVPDASGTVHVSSPGIGYRSSDASAALLAAATCAPVLYEPNWFLLDPEPQPCVLPHAILDKDQLVQILGSEETVLRSLRACRFGTEAQALELLTFMEEAVRTWTAT